MNLLGSDNNKPHTAKFHSNCRYNEFSHYIECQYEEGWLYITSWI